MNIGIDGRVLYSGASNRGVGYYTINLLRNLSKIRTSKTKFVLYTAALHKKILLNNFKNYEVLTLYRPRKIVRMFDIFFSLIWSTALKKSKPNLLHITHLFEWYYLSIPNNIKTIVTIYDLIPLIYRDKYLNKTKEFNWYISRLNQIKNVTKIITISEASKNDIVHFLKIPGSKISVIHLGVSDLFKPISKIDSQKKIKKKYKIEDPFILSVSTHSYHKNTEALFKAYKKFINNPKFQNYKLIVICKLINSERKDWEDKIKYNKLEKNVIFTGFIPDEDMPYFYNASDFFVFPSLYEGFGLPILEAMACGTPVITSKVSSMPEVGGSAALYINPYSVDDICTKMKKLIDNKKLQNDLIKKGFKQVKKFSWSKCAEETLKVYESVLSN